MRSTIWWLQDLLSPEWEVLCPYPPLDIATLPSITRRVADQRYTPPHIIPPRFFSTLRSHHLRLPGTHNYFLSSCQDKSYPVSNDSSYLRCALKRPLTVAAISRLSFTNIQIALMYPSSGRMCSLFQFDDFCTYSTHDSSSPIDVA